MKTETIKAISERYGKRKEDLEIMIGVDLDYNHFNHIANNLLAIITGTLGLLEMGKKWDDYRKDFVESIRLIKRYFRLIEKYPEFAREEATKADGYFSDLHREVVSHGPYIDEAYRRLTA